LKQPSLDFDRHLPTIQQALEFLIDGYETTAQAMALISFELARHPDIQERLYKDVMNILDQFVSIVSCRVAVTRLSI